MFGLFIDQGLSGQEKTEEFEASTLLLQEEISKIWKTQEHRRTQVHGRFPETMGKYNKRKCCKSSKAPQTNAEDFAGLLDWQYAHADVAEQGFGII